MRISLGCGGAPHSIDLIYNRRVSLRCFWMFAVLTGSTLLQAADSTTPIFRAKRYTVNSDSVREGKFETRALSSTQLESNYSPDGKNTQPRRWQLTEDVSGYPQLRSAHVLLDALYNLSLEELHRDIRQDGAFMAGAKWEGVWTRDISYSIVLALAAVEPAAAKASLLQKVARNRIVQDTGTGGSWPVSTDRMTWALAAWEIYLVTGDHDWLAQSFAIIRDSAADDEAVIFSKQTGLAFGESSFLDWREQTYPRWMTPADIFNSHSLGTNAVHYRTYQILARMAKLLGQPSETYEATANRIRDGMNRFLWLDQNGYYGQCLYGWNALSVSPRAEALGESLAVLFDIASEKQQQRILQNTPVMEYGIPSIYPQIPGIPPYHNNAVWPFVQAFWNLAAAKRHDGPALVQGMSALCRAAALFLTNQENMVADTGSSQGTQINSARQLWSVAGNLAMTYRVLFGMSFGEDGLHLAPVVPKEFAGAATLDNFKYRDALLSFHIEGYGSSPKSITLDSEPLNGALIPADLTGKHTIQILMANDDLPNAGLHVVEPAVSPETPVLSRDSAILHWTAVPGSEEYVVVKNGERVTNTKELSYTLPVSSGYAEYQVSAVGKDGSHSFLSQPVLADDREGTITEAELAGTVSTEKLTGFTGSGFVEISRSVNRSLTWHAKVADSGTYAIDFRYSNGSGPVNTENKCALRSLSVDGKALGAIVFPQRGKDEWSKWGYSSHQHVNLTEGDHDIRLLFDPADENMNGDTNRAMLDHLRLMRIYTEPDRRF